MSRLSTIRGNRWQVLSVVIASVGLLGGIVCQPVPTLAEERNWMSHTLIVSGRGTVEIPKTVSQVSLGVQVQTDTSEQAQQEIARRSSRVVQLLKDNPDVKKLETTTISLSPRYNYRNGKQEIVGYTASNLVKFQIAPEKMGQLLDAAVTAGATRIDGMTMVASDAAIAAAQKAAIALASRDAQSQAEASLTALNLKQQEIVQIQIDNARVQPPQPPMMARMEADGMAASPPSTPVIAGEQQIEATVTLQIRYQPR